MSSGKEFSFKAGSDVFTPKNLIELARPGAGLANPAGDLVLVPVSKFSFEDKKNTKSIFIAPLESSITPLEIPLTTGGEAFWLDSKTIGHVVGDEGTKTSSLFAISIEITPQSVSTPQPPALVGSFPTTTLTNFQYAAKPGVLVFSDNVYEDGNLTAVKEHDQAWENRGNSAFVYDDTYVRHWDTYVGPKKPTLFSVRVFRGPDKKWLFGPAPLNLLKGIGHHTPVEPFGGTDDFSLSDTHVVYTTKDPDLPEAWHTKQNVYLVSLDGIDRPRELTSGKQGATHSPVFSPGGDKVAWTELDEDGYEADRAKIVIYDLVKDVRFTVTQPWDRSAESLAFSQDSNFLYLTAGDIARVKVFVLPVPATPEQSTAHPALPPYYTIPCPLTSSGAASGLQTLPGGRIVYSLSSATSPNDVFIIRDLHALEAEYERTKVVSEEPWKGGEEIWFEGAEGKQVQGWVYKPKGYKEGEGKRQWPAILLIHGGPQGAWEDGWSTRWNPVVFAQQGYFVVALNPTGSTTFGQKFTDAIAKDWGGKPFVDMQKGWKHALEKYPAINPDRAAAAGASWGGYAINWIQGHPEYDFNFKALVCHDGVFDAKYNGYSTDELFFFNHEWGGRPWDTKTQEVLAKFNPTNFVHRWSTPQLTIHGSKDYRLPETDGIGAFHALQQLGIASRLVVFPNENHWVLDHGNSLKWHHEVFRWLDLYTGKGSAESDKIEVVQLKN
ncbi:hypothetical protein EWM64_g147 [Hericium alpestre]|uniref:Dipeptidyl-peptidase V n=1 Tax=Hericium alpestre TaxID=135208 RepID=A0A4Z0AC03_9AGAM|nr:hypothetical protein EWM64_g147 [Hericium alpestre]